jgi:hypothetical protein
LILYSLVWAIFKPGDLAYNSTTRQLYEVIQTYYRPTQAGVVFIVVVQLVDWDGAKFGYLVSEAQFPQYNGTQEITKLSCFPVEYHPSAAQIKNDCLVRGQKFYSLAGVHHKGCRGRGKQCKKQHQEVFTEPRPVS